MMKLKIKDVEFGYTSRPVLKNICLELAPTEMLGVVGPNGAGKSTIIRCLNNILTPQKGTILLDEEEMKKMRRLALAKKIGYVPQSTAQVFSATVFDTVLMGRRPHLSWQSGKKDEKIVLDTLEMLNIIEIAMSDINELSGGQQQKVFIARALAQEPEVLLLDEPTSNLDIRHQLEVMNIIQNLVHEKGITVVMAIHDLNLASRYAEKIIMMHSGKVFSAGIPTAVFTPENIEQVYRVKVKVNSDSEMPYILPLQPI